jgi:hypothetical protein
MGHKPPLTVAQGLGRVKTKNVKLRLEAHSSYRQLMDENAQVRVTGTISEKFILGIFLLDAFSHSQGHDQPIEVFPQQVRPRDSQRSNPGSISRLSRVAAALSPALYEGQRLVLRQHSQINFPAGSSAP